MSAMPMKAALPARGAVRKPNAAPVWCRQVESAVTARISP
jgi:hypothetical protein